MGSLWNDDEIKYKEKFVIITKCMKLSRDTSAEVNYSVHTTVKQDIQPVSSLKLHYVGFQEKNRTQNFNIHNIEVIIQTQKYILFLDNWINKLLSEENKIPRALFEEREWQGPPHKNKVKNIIFFFFFFFIKNTQFNYIHIYTYNNKNNKEEARSGAQIN